MYFSRLRLSALSKIQKYLHKLIHGIVNKGLSVLPGLIHLLSEADHIPLISLQWKSFSSHFHHYALNLFNYWYYSGTILPYSPPSLSFPQYKCINYFLLYLFSCNQISQLLFYSPHHKQHFSKPFTKLHASSYCIVTNQNTKKYPSSNDSFEHALHLAFVCTEFQLLSSQL